MQLLSFARVTPKIESTACESTDGLYGRGCAGSRHEALTVLPHGTANHVLTLVGYMPGSLPLPHVRITALRYNAVVEPLAAHRLLVSPAGLSSADKKQ